MKMIEIPQSPPYVIYPVCDKPRCGAKIVRVELRTVIVVAGTDALQDDRRYFCEVICANGHSKKEGFLQ